jgi:hypothetical protein
MVPTRGESILRIHRSESQGGEFDGFPLCGEPTLRTSQSQTRRYPSLVRLPPLGGEGWGGGILGECLQFIDRPSDRIHDRADVFVQLLISEANDAEAACGEPVGTPLIMLDGFRFQMLRAIELDDELVLKANKIDDVWADCPLATKLPATEFLGAEEVP